MSEAADTMTTDTPSTPASDEAPLTLEGFSSEMVGLGNPEDTRVGHAEPAEAVEQSEAQEPEAAEPDKAEEAPGDDAESDKSEAEQTVNFDGFTDEQKTTWEKLLSEGHVTPDFVEEARTGTLRQSAFTKKTMALADERRAFEAEMEEKRDDLALLAKIRGDDRLHDAWMRMAKGEVATAAAGDDPDADGDDLITRKAAERIADQRFEARLAELQARTAAQQKTYDARKAAITEAMQESMKTLGVSADVLRTYLEAEEAMLPPDVDPILHFKPEQLQDRVARRHETAALKAKIADLEKRVSQRTSDEARAAKASSPPARRVSVRGDMSPMQKTVEELGIAPDWSNVEGFGQRPTD